MPEEEARPLLVVGLPRAGTTWVAGVLGRAAGATPRHEPDNAKEWPGAVPATRALGRFPALRPGERDASYHRLWQTVLLGPDRTQERREQVVKRLWGQPSTDALEEVAQGRPPLRLRLAGYAALASRCLPSAATGKTCRVVKSVHAALAVEWIAETFAPSVVIVVRHPANVLASWLELELPDRGRNLHLEPRARERYARPWGLPDPQPGPLAATVWQLGLLLSALEQAADRHPEWTVVSHDHLCVDPEAAFEALTARLGLPWTEGTADFLRQGNRPGRGFETAREASNLPESWRRRLGPGEIEELKRTLAHFPLHRWRVDELPGPTPGDG